MSIPNKIIDRRGFLSRLFKLIALSSIVAKWMFSVAVANNLKWLDLSRIFKAANLAASAGNSKPWIINQTGPNIVKVSESTNPASLNDRFKRKKYISIGCAIENIVVCSEGEGYSPKILLDKNPDISNCATITLKINPAPISPEVAAMAIAIKTRYVNRNKYLDTPLSNVQLRELTALNDTPSIRLVNIADVNERKRITRLIKNYAKPHAHFSHFDTGAFFGFIEANDPKSKLQLMDVGRLFEKIQLWATANQLASQIVGCAMITQMESYYFDEKDNEFVRELIDIYPQLNSNVIIGLRIGVADTA